MKVKFNNGWDLELEYEEDSEKSLTGFVRDGHFWIDYDKVTKTIHVCTGTLGVIRWDAPINKVENVEIV